MQEHSESFELLNEWLASLKAANPGIAVEMEVSERECSVAEDGSQESSFERVMMTPPQIEELFQAGASRSLLAIDAAHSQVGASCAA